MFLIHLAVTPRARLSTMFPAALSMVSHSRGPMPISSLVKQNYSRIYGIFATSQAVQGMNGMKHVRMVEELVAMQLFHLWRPEQV